MHLLQKRKTPLPIVQGPQTAVVVGEGEIDCDEYGRILVHFHWDLEKAFSMRCRVSQNWASQGWGGMVIPRIGMEVIVEFLEGDPDKPIVTGCVYNGKNKVPYELPKHKTRSTFRTDTHKGTGFNELRFEDEKGREEIFVHAQKDMSVRVLDNKVSHIDGSEIKVVRHDTQELVEGSLSQRVLGNTTISVGFETAFREADNYLNLKDDNLQSNLTSGAQAKVITNNLGGMFTLAAKKVLALISKDSTLIRSDNNTSIAAKNDVHINADKDIELSATKNVDIRSEKSTSLSSGGDLVINTNGARITITRDGEAHLEAKNIYFNARQNVEIDAGGEIFLRGSKINLN